MMKILVVDDNIEIRETISFYCEAKDIQCIVISNGLEGLKEIRKNSYDLILLDVAMPTYSGIDVINSLKNEGLLASKNIVIFTASSDPKTLYDLTNSGVKGIFRKPGSLEELADLITRYSPEKND